MSCIISKLRVYKHLFNNNDDLKGRSIQYICNFIHFDLFLSTKFALYTFLHSDIDECMTETDNCLNSPGVCTNTDGSFTCDCMSGYTGDGVMACELEGIHNSEFFFTYMSFIFRITS